MSIAITKAAVLVAMRAITGIGLVDGNAGRTEGLPWEVSTGAVKPLWTVHLAKGAGLALDKPKLNGTMVLGYTWHIKGYFPFDFEASSEEAFDAYLDLVQAKFKSFKSLSTCSHTEPIQVLENDFVMYQGSGGAVLCHYALIELQTESWE